MLLPFEVILVSLLGQSDFGLRRALRLLGESVQQKELLAGHRRTKLTGQTMIVLIVLFATTRSCSRQQILLPIPGVDVPGVIRLGRGQPRAAEAPIVGQHAEAEVQGVIRHLIVQNLERGEDQLIAG